MLKIIEQKDKNAYAALRAEFPAHVLLHITEAVEDSGAVSGYIAYAYEPEQVVIYAVEDGGDPDACDGLVRSVLFKAELRGLERAAFAMDEPPAHLRQLGFVRNDEKHLKILRKLWKVAKNVRKSRQILEKNRKK